VSREADNRLFSCREDLESGAPFRELPTLLNRLEKSHATRGNVLFYLSVPPVSYEPIVRSIAASALSRSSDAWRRIIVEKPVGHDLPSALALHRALDAAFSEDQIYRIDHYMGKETVQNILVLRLANTIMEPLWNSHFIDHVQITASETLGVESRAGYYDGTGALRDMIQNHLLQTLAMIAMEPPATLLPEAIRDEKQKVLRAVRPLTEAHLTQFIVRAQYAAGSSGDVNVPAYRAESGVRVDSTTETFCALRLWVDNWRWHGVPFYLRTGKRLPKRVTEIAIQFRPVPHMVFETTPVDLVQPNVLSIRIQPNEGITLKFMAKSPGHEIRLRPVDMEFRYGTSFGGRIGDAYEQLLLDAMQGDMMLFARRDSVEQSWHILAPVLDAWAEGRGGPLLHYPAGSWGPPEADALLRADGREWRDL